MIFLGPLHIYLQHVLQTIIYFMKIGSKNIYFKNSPALPLEIEWCPPKIPQIYVSNFVKPMTGQNTLHKESIKLEVMRYDIMLCQTSYALCAFYKFTI